jgi:molecular chaperone HtpG
MSEAAQCETHEFQAEVQELLKLMIHSLYSNKEIFLRELISNASDACDRLRFEALTSPGLLEDGDELDIRVQGDPGDGIVTVVDNGIGMTRDEVIENIGTIARSGTRRFLESMTADKSRDARLIGQFGVGFYSAFLVARRVELRTRKAGEPAESGVRWISDGTGKYSIEPLTLAERGTTVVLHLRDDDKEYARPERLRAIAARYSDHISLPILMPREAGGEGGGDEWQTVNAGSALWARPRNEISDEDYVKFYQSLTYDDEKPLLTIHNRVEGGLDYVSLLFIPSRTPFDLWDRERRYGVNLYVRRIFIMDDARYLMPAYLRFVRGVVDAADLPLNVSREFLQNNRDIDKIRAGSVKKVLGELERLAEDDGERYATFWREFGRVLKEGIIEDDSNRTRIARLLRFDTTRSEGDGQDVPLQQYVQRMPMKQKAIYYLTADSLAAARQSPHLEVFRKHGIEVLLLGDPVDEWVVNALNEFEGRPLKSVARGALDLEDLPEGAKAAPDSPDTGGDQAFDTLLERFRAVLGERVKDVRLSRRLTDSPACLVADEHDLGANLERILKAMGQEAPTSRPILELNPGHPIIVRLRDGGDDRIDDWAFVLFDQAALSEGAALAEPAAYVRRVNALLSGGE